MSDLACSDPHVVWTHLVPPDDGRVASPRHGHSCVVWNGCIYAFGGSWAGAVNHDLYRLDPRLPVPMWHRIDGVTGTVPSERSDHAAVVHASAACMYVLYGRGNKCTYHADVLYRFHFRTNHWEQLETTGRVPKQRSCHEAVLLERHPTLHVPVILLFGGWNMRKYMRHLYMLRLDTLEWSKFPHYGPHEPKPRLCHGMRASPDGASVYVFGGECFTGEYLNDLLRYDVLHNTWSELPTQHAPPARHGHRMEVHGHYLYVFGGYDGLRFFGDVHRLRLPLHSSSTDEPLVWQHVPAVCGGLCPPTLTCIGLVLMAGRECSSPLGDSEARPAASDALAAPAAAAAALPAAQAYPMARPPEHPHHPLQARYRFEHTPPSDRPWIGLRRPPPPPDQLPPQLRPHLRLFPPEQCRCGGTGHQRSPGQLRLRLFVFGGWLFVGDGDDVRSAELFRGDVYDEGTEVEEEERQTAPYGSGAKD